MLATPVSRIAVAAVAMPIPGDVAADTAQGHSDAVGVAPNILAEGSAAGAGEAAGIAISLCTDLAELEAAWREFEPVADCTPFQSFDWLAKWQRHIGTARATIPLIVVGRSQSGDIAFLLPLSVEKKRGIRQLVWLANERCDYNGPLLSRATSGLGLDWDRIWTQVLARIRAETGISIDLVNLQKMPERVGGQANPFLSLKVTRHPNDGHVATLGSAWEGFYKERRSSSSRKVQRKQLNRLAECGDLRFVDSGDCTQVETTLNILVEQKRRALARMGVGDMFLRPGVRDFYMDLACDRRATGSVHVSRLEIGDEVGATSVGLVHRGRYYLILSSYNDGPLSRHGPGRAHLMELLRRAMELGLREFDFTIGNEPYKLDWCDVRLPLYDHLAATSPRGLAARLVLQAANAGHRAIRNNPKAWQGFMKLRAMLRSLAGGYRATAGDRPAGNAEG